MPGVGCFVRSQLLVTPPEPTGDLTGKTVIVTGSNVGLGKEAARHFTSLNASTVVLAVRSLEKGEAACRDIEATTGRKGVIKIMHLDMSYYQSVLDFASHAYHELDRIDIAVLNAGVNRGKWEIFEQDESTITVNVVSTFLLAFALLPKLRETATRFTTRPTLTIVNSEVHQWTGFSELKAPEGQLFQRLNQEEVNGKKVDLNDRYYVSKLMGVFFVREFCKRHPGTNFPVTVNLVSPGFCHSEFGREASAAIAVARATFARTTEVGSRTLVNAGMYGPQSHGQYLNDCKIGEPGKNVTGREGKLNQLRVWREMMAKLEGITPGITAGY